MLLVEKAAFATVTCRLAARSIFGRSHPFPTLVKARSHMTVSLEHWWVPYNFPYMLQCFICYMNSNTSHVRSHRVQLFSGHAVNQDRQPGQLLEKAFGLCYQVIL